MRFVLSRARSSHWAGERERGSSALLKAMLWIALRLSRSLSEMLLWPITAWFMATSPAARVASREFLARALGREPHRSEIVRHFFTFACAILDRVFLLAGRLDRFTFSVEGLEHVVARIEQGRGCILVGAHLGSFEAMRALGRRAPVRIRPAMFRANAGALTSILERLDPELAAQIIDIGRPDAMLQVRESLDRGDLVAFLADRATDPKRSLAVPFLGVPALFPTGPFRIAAILAVPVVLFHGIRTGRRRYVLHFEPLTDGIAAPARARSEVLRREVGAYVARLEAACRATPFQWFNFYPFWQEADSPRNSPSPTSPARRRRTLGPALALALLALPSPVRAGNGGLLPAVMHMLSSRPSRQTSFHEEKTVRGLTKPLASKGVLIFRRPGYLEKRTSSPIRENLVVDGARVSVAEGEDAPRVLDVDAHPELRVMVDAFLGVLSGDLGVLREHFDVVAEGSVANWRITLLPHDADANALLRSVAVTGSAADIREVRLLQPHGNWDILTVDGG